MKRYDNRNDFGYRDQNERQYRNPLRHQQEQQQHRNRYNYRDQYQQDNYGRYREENEWSRRNRNPNYTEEDFLGTLYETTNYDGIPNRSDYGRRHPNQEYGHNVEPYPETREWYSRIDHDNYHTYHGYDPNYDDPTEGYRYRNWDVRGNYGYRHDPSYGHSDSMLGYDDNVYQLPRERRRNYTGTGGR
ncbi:MAG: hypothetical protein LPK19_01735 [Hymenobacteraceae bacterium]|nr:hypothetical protein [Hymenobacteraceae bacterium]MDX5394895.1 hypothetical protein [Hymenobacteraceae bacterium]MDX5510931.1 hypothetical protein [Hymenobacteraceae bacterium]